MRGIPRTDLTREQLVAEYSYDPSTGLFYRLSDRVGAPRGQVLGRLTSSRYLQIAVGGKAFSAHRLAWLYMTGEWPKHMVDHINGVRHDNRWSNLRDVTRSVNMENQRKAMRTNKSGFLGVSVHKLGFQAAIHTAGKCHYLGIYRTPQEAHSVYLEAKRRLHKGNTL